MAKLTDKAVIAAIIKEDGNVTAAARKLGVCRAAITKRMSKNPEIATAVAEAMEALIDDSVSVIKAHIKKKSFAAARYVTETLGQGRGWMRMENLQPELAAMHEENQKMRDENAKLYAQLERALAAIANGGSQGTGDQPQPSAQSAGTE